MSVSAWQHWWWLVDLGAAVVVGAWTSGLIADIRGDTPADQGPNTGKGH